MAIGDMLSRFSWHPAAQNAISSLYAAGFSPYGPPPRSTYDRGGGSSSSQSSGYAPSPGYSAYGYPDETAVDPGTGKVRGGAGMEDVPGWAGKQGYTGLALNDLRYSPELVLPDVLGKRAATGPVGQMIQDVPYDPYNIYMLTAGNEKKSLDAGSAGFANWLGKDFYPDLAQGQQLDFGNLIGALEDPRKNSALGAMVEQAGPAGQANLFSTFLYDAANATMGPEVAQALIGMGQDSAMLQGNRGLSAGPNSNNNYMKRMVRGLGF